MRRAMNIARIAASAAIFTFLSAACATAKPIATTAETNLRKSPGTDSPVLTIIPKGTTVEVGKCNNGWCETSVDGRDGFVIARNLGMAPRPRPAPQVYDEEEVVGPAYGPRAYIVGPPVYGYRPYGYGPYYGYYGGWGYRGWGWRW
jgi:Bacterial SH3 domain